MHAWLRAESENASAAVAAADVNTRMARVLAKLKALPSISVASSGYSTDAIVDKGKPTRWRVSQSVKLDSADFAALATEIGKLQDDGLLLSGLGFSLSDAARKTAEDSVTQQAIKSWQQRAQNAAQALGYARVARRHRPRAEQRRRAAVHGDAQRNEDDAPRPRRSRPTPGRPTSRST